ncbi:MAG: SpoIID/LytB domain-containing protein [Candidatus Riflebacteria bacterium]
MKYKNLYLWRISALFIGMFFIFSVSSLLAAEKNINIKVAQYASSIDFICPQGASYELGGQPGSIVAGDNCKLTGVITEKARKRYHVMVFSAFIGDDEAAKSAEIEWREAGFTYKTSTIGRQFFGDDGSLLYDNRTIRGEVGVFDDLESAQRLVDRLAAQGKSSWINTEIVSWSKGSLTLSINGSEKATGESLLLVPAGKVALKKVEYAVGYPWHGFADRNYTGTLTCRFGASDAIDCILNTSLENVLAGVVPSEISANAETGALQAQAVAARGEILAKIGIRHAGEGFDTCSEQHCQVFAGDTTYTAQVAPKIAPTRGYVLKDGSKILDAVYAANCGGHSEANHLVWTTKPNPILGGRWDIGTPPALDLSEERQVTDFINNPPRCYCNNPNVEGGNRFRWTKSINATDWKAVCERVGIGRIKTIKNIARGFSGRMYQITFVGERGEKTVMKELNIRKIYGSLMSACFIADYKRDAAGYIVSAEIKGAGFGHGVGMCQTGAQSLAKQGWSFDRILSHYFPGSVLQKLY